ncbi:hypothetical protein [Geodermatophilus amargosae]|uniref:hypothetical protein n=1 Tax=Geodermatophilus amargosae TaxID=1296565 RepID=UPI000B8A1324|nr:hypothetical protein [Geodermatophilus amargosae]
MHPTVRSQWRAAWWVLLLGLVAVVLFGAAFAVRLSCGLGYCTAPAVRQLLSLDAVGGLPRLFTTGVLAAAGVLAGVRGWSVRGRVRLWWAGVAVTGLVLAVLKSDSALESEASPTETLVLGLAVAVPALALLSGAGRAWGVAGATRVVSAFAGYALTALGLDAFTGLVEAVQDDAGTVSEYSAAFIEELGEALAALAVLAVVRAATAVSRTGR